MLDILSTALRSCLGVYGDQNAISMSCQVGDTVILWLGFGLFYQNRLSRICSCSGVTERLERRGRNTSLYELLVDYRQELGGFVARYRDWSTDLELRLSLRILIMISPPD